MILRSPAENENGGIPFPMALSSTRHFRRRTDQPQTAWLARARGNPGSLRRINLDTRFRGYDGTQAGLLVLVPKQVFSKEDTKHALSKVEGSTKFKNKISATFVSFVLLCLKFFAACANFLPVCASWTTGASDFLPPRRQDAK